MQPQATLVAWPESPAPFHEEEPRTAALIEQLVSVTGATAVVGNAAVEPSGAYFNAGTVTAPGGTHLGRYDKIHLVPFGEYVPYAGLLSFAGHLTQNVAAFSEAPHETSSRWSPPPAVPPTAFLSSSATKPSSPPRSGSSPKTVPRSSSTSPMTAGMATPAPPGST